MRLSVRLAILLFFCCSFVHIHAANEWKNPDLAPTKKKTTTPTPSPAPVAKSAPRPGPSLKGRLGLEVVRVCDYQFSYNDKGSGGKIDVSFYIPNIPNGYAMIGTYAQGNYKEPSDCILAVKPVDRQSIALLQVPHSWERLWTDKGSGASMDGSIWHPTAQSSEYICLGSVAQKGYRQPALTNYVCVHQCLVESIPSAYRIWSTKGTGSKQTAYIYKLHNSNSFYTLGNKIRPAELRDLKGDTRCTF